MKRRNLLKATATATTITGFGVASSTARGQTNARTQRIRNARLKKARKEYESSLRARVAVEAHGKNILQELANQGILEEASTSKLPMQTLSEHGTGKIEGTKVFASEENEGRFTAHITVIMETDDREVRLNVRPHVGHSHAIIKSPDETKIVDSSGDVGIARRCQEDVTCFECSCCTGELECGSSQKNEQTKECCWSGSNPDNSTCDIIDRSCCYGTC